MRPKQSLGKGLGAIFPDLIGDIKGKSALITCGIEELSPNRFQPRKDFNEKALKNLAASIKKSGIIQPIIVRRAGTGYEIITGERRWRAAQEAGLKDVPVIIKDAGDGDIAEWSLVENLQREDLNPIEEGEAYQTLIGQFGLSQEDIAVKLGKDRTTITNALRLLKLVPEVKAALVGKSITAGHARAILACGASKEQLLALNTIVKKNLSVRQAEAMAKHWKSGEPDKPSSKKNAALSDLEKTLSSRLMTAVKIRGKKNSGSIVIKFSSSDELDRLVMSILKALA